jgi:hypothetical protein
MSDYLNPGSRDPGSIIDEMLASARFPDFLKSRATEAGTLTDVSEIRGEGTAADGRIRATVIAGGRLESLIADPRVMRMGSADLCQEIVLAVNAAVDERQTKTGEHSGAAINVVDLSEKLQELQDTLLRQMEMFTKATNDTAARLEKRR